METTLVYLLTAIFVFSVFHFIYESIFVPSERMLIRDELFQLRDSLRDAYSSYDPNDKEAFNILHENGINHSLNNLSIFNLLTQIKAIIAFDKNPKLDEDLKAKIALIESAKSPVITENFKLFMKLIDRSYVLNSGGWAFYIVPIILTILFADALRRALLSSVFSTDTTKDSSHQSQYV